MPNNDTETNRNSQQNEQIMLVQSNDASVIVPLEQRGETVLFANEQQN